MHQYDKSRWFHLGNLTKSGQRIASFHPALPPPASLHFIGKTHVSLQNRGLSSESFVQWFSRSICLILPRRRFLQGPRLCPDPDLALLRSLVTWPDEGWKASTRIFINQSLFILVANIYIYKGFMQGPKGRMSISPDWSGCLTTFHGGLQSDLVGACREFIPLLYFSFPLL